jgi:hypothetical protein
MDVTQEIKQLITKAASAHDSIQALQFSQAAVNVANAMGSLDHIERERRDASVDKKKDS